MTWPTVETGPDHSMTKYDTLFYVSNYKDHLNMIAPEHSVFKPVRSTQDRRSMPLFRTPDVREGKVPGVRSKPLPDGFDGWEHFVCDWTDADMAAMGVDHVFEADEAYLDMWPDAWFMATLIVNAKARAAYEKHAPNACLFFPIHVKSKATGEVLDVERWAVYAWNWVQVAPVDGAKPRTDFGSTVDDTLFAQAQEHPERAAFLKDFDLFSSFGGKQPVYAADLFHALASEGVTGLTEKQSTSKHFHQLREVITHVWI